MSIFFFAKKYFVLNVLLLATVTIIVNLLNRGEVMLSSILLVSMAVAPLLNGFVFRYHLKKDKLKTETPWKLFRLALLPIVLANIFFYIVGSFSGIGNFILLDFILLILSTLCYQATLVLVQFKYNFWFSLAIDYIMLAVEFLLSFLIIR